MLISQRSYCLLSLPFNSCCFSSQLLTQHRQATLWPSAILCSHSHRGTNNLCVRAYFWELRGVDLLFPWTDEREVWQHSYISQCLIRSLYKVQVHLLRFAFLYCLICRAGQYNAEVMRNYMQCTFLWVSWVIISTSVTLIDSLVKNDRNHVFCKCVAAILQYCVLKSIHFDPQWTGVAAGFHPSQIEATPNNW